MDKPRNEEIFDRLEEFMEAVRVWSEKATDDDKTWFFATMMRFVVSVPSFHKRDHYYKLKRVGASLRA